MNLPDLLSPNGNQRFEPRSLRQALAFAFATGDAAGALDRELCKPRFGAQCWKAAQFGPGLFVTELVREHFLHKEPSKDWAAAYLVRCLGRAPTDAATIIWRQSTLTEMLANPGLLKEFQESYAALCRLRLMLVAGPLGRDQAIRRRIDLLGQFKQCIDALALRFESSSYALAKLRQFARACQQDAGYAQLHDLLDFERKSVTLKVQLTLGQEGQLQHLHLLEARENSDNPHHVGFFKRLSQWLPLWFRGKRLRKQELVGTLIEGVYAGVEPWLEGLCTCLGDLMIYRAALSFRTECLERGLPVCLAELGQGSRYGELRLKGLYNPLLLSHPRRPVPADYDSGRGQVALITGPNSGGKTRFLQAVALAQVLGQAGLFVAAEHALIPVAPSLLISLAPDAAADQPEGHLGSELLRLRGLFEELTAGSMLLVDELCSGTNPAEGEEILQVLLDVLCEARAHTLVTTHFLRFAAELQQRARSASLQFLQVELDADSMPTYRFTEGVATTSLASQTAKRLGVTRSQLLALLARNRERQQDSTPPATTNPQAACESP